jgi:hypothetical protein
LFATLSQYLSSSVQLVSGLSDQTKELTALGQKAGQGAELIARSFDQAFKKAS